MEIGVWLKEWVQVLGAGITLLAVLVALGIGVYSFIQTNRLKRTEKRERLLNEIIEWAVEILKFTPMPNQTIFEPKFKTEEQTTVEDAIMLWQAELQEILLPVIAKGAYITRISRALGKSMWSATNKTSLCLGNIVGHINELEGTHSNIETLGKSNKELRDAAVEIIEEATKIKTQDIG